MALNFKHINGNEQILDGSIGTDLIADGAITAAKLAAGSIPSSAFVVDSDIDFNNFQALQFRVENVDFFPVPGNPGRLIWRTDLRDLYVDTDFALNISSARYIPLEVHSVISPTSMSVSSTAGMLVGDAIFQGGVPFGDVEIVEIVDLTHIIVDSTVGISVGDVIGQDNASTTVTTITDTTHLVVASTIGFIPDVAVVSTPYILATITGVTDSTHVIVNSTAGFTGQATASVNFGIVTVTNATDLEIDNSTAISVGDVIVQGLASTTVTAVVDLTHIVVTSTTGFSVGIADVLVLIDILAIPNGTDLTVSKTTGFGPGNPITQGVASTTIVSVTDGTHLVVASTSGFQLNAATDSTVTVDDTSNVNAGMLLTQGVNSSIILSVMDATTLAIVNASPFVAGPAFTGNWVAINDGGSVNSIRSDANPQLQGNITFLSGTNVDLLQVSQTITVDVPAAGITGQIQFNDGLDVFGADPNFFWDNINKRLGIKTSAPSSTLDVAGDANVDAAMTIGDTLDVVAATTLNDTLHVVGTSQLDGAVTVDDTLDVTGATTLDDTLAVTNLATFADQVGIGTAIPDASASLEVLSTTRGILIPRLTTTQRDAIVSPAIGLLIYNTSTSLFNFWTGSSWLPVGSPVGNVGDVQFNAGGGLFGADPIFHWDDLNNRLGIGTATPTTTLDVTGTVNVSGAVTLGSTLDVTDAVTLNNTLDVTNATTLNSTLDVTAATTLNNTLDVVGAATLQNTLDVTAATTLNDTLDVTNATTLNNTLDVTGATTLNSTLDVTGATTLNNTLDVTGATTLQNTLDVTGLATFLNEIQMSADQRIIFDIAADSFIKYSTPHGGMVLQAGPGSNANLNFENGIAMWANTLADGSGTYSPAFVMNNTDGVNISTATGGVLVDDDLTGSGPVPSAKLEVKSLTRGFLTPRMTTTQRDAIVSPATGLLLYNTTTNQEEYYNGTIWSPIGNTAVAGVNGDVQFNNNGVFGADNANFFWDDINDRLGLGTNTPSERLQVSGNVQIDLNMNSSSITTGLETIQTGADFSPHNNLILTSGSVIGNGTPRFGPGILITTANIVSAGAAGRIVGGDITLTTGQDTGFGAGNETGGSITLTSFTPSKGGSITLTGTGASRGTITAGGNMSIDGTTFNVDSVNHRVGVGTATPATILDVTGNAHISSDLTVDTQINTDLIVSRTGDLTVQPLVDSGTGFNVKAAGATRDVIVVDTVNSVLQLHPRGDGYAEAQIRGTGTYLNFANTAGSVYYTQFANNPALDFRLTTIDPLMDIKLIQDRDGNAWTWNFDKLGTLTTPGQIQTPNGSASAPSYSFVSNSNIGMWSDGSTLINETGSSGQFVFHTASGSNQLRFDVGATDEAYFGWEDGLGLSRWESRTGIRIATDFAGTPKNWDFDATGVATFPGTLRNTNSVDDILLGTAPIAGIYAISAHTDGIALKATSIFTEIDFYKNDNSFVGLIGSDTVAGDIYIENDVRHIWLRPLTGSVLVDAVGATPVVDASALLQVNSTTQGFLHPRMTTTQRNAIVTPAAGLTVYDTTLNLLQLYNGTSWVTVGQAIFEQDVFDITGPGNVFNLSFTPINNSQVVYYNGLALAPGVTEDYTISGNVVTLDGSIVLANGDKILVVYSHY